MNRIILIGNGFDLAHGLKTGYRDFIDNFWKQTAIEFGKPENVKDGTFETNMLSINVELPIHPMPLHLQEVKSHNDFLTYLEKEKEQHKNKTAMSINFKNKFLELITNKAGLLNWVDIEDEYYQQLKNIVQYEKTGRFNYYTDIQNLNKDFEEIKQALCEYLKDEEQKEIEKYHAINHITSQFHLKDFPAKYISVLKDEFSPKNKEKEEEYNKDFEHKLMYSQYDNIGNPAGVLFLNFNYTNLCQKIVASTGGNGWRLSEWDRNTPVSIIPIHNNLNDTKKNPIIFGYGDEQDEAHKEIEKLGGSYLDNVKTINYLKTPNYRNLLKFIESGLYQIFIMGHSCGLSDKTLLNTLFEHDNCVSIKPFYYIDNNGHNNYDDIIKNIYRIFTDKTLMREKVVNLEYCEPLKG